MGAGLLSLEQSYLIDLFMMMEMVSTCAVQRGHHQPYVAIEHLEYSKFKLSLKCKMHIRLLLKKCKISQ